MLWWLVDAADGPIGHGCCHCVVAAAVAAAAANGASGRGGCGAVVVLVVVVARRRVHRELVHGRGGRTATAVVATAASTHRRQLLAHDMRTMRHGCGVECVAGFELRCVCSVFIVAVVWIREQDCFTLSLLCCHCTDLLKARNNCTANYKTHAQHTHTRLFSS